MREAKNHPNPAGKHGKPFTLAPMKFEDALRKILAAPPEPKASKGINPVQHSEGKAAPKPVKPAKKKPVSRKK